MYDIEPMIERLKGHPKTIAFTEGTDPRIQEVVSRFHAGNFIRPLLIGDRDEINAASAESGYGVRDVEVINPAHFDRFDEMVSILCELRAEKGMTEDDARNCLLKYNYFGTMLVKMGIADCLLGGATYSTIDSVRPAIQILGIRPGNRLVSSCMILSRPNVTGYDDMIALADCAVNIDPSEDEIVEIASETARYAEMFGMEPKIALLSYSTGGSGHGASADKMHRAAETLRRLHPELMAEGEIQFDASVTPRIAQQKLPGSPVAGFANTFIFPNLNSANIGFMIAKNIGNFDAYGPIFMGLNGSINDLSRGCSAEEAYVMGVVTASLAYYRSHEGK